MTSLGLIRRVGGYRIELEGSHTELFCFSQQSDNNPHWQMTEEVLADKVKLLPPVNGHVNSLQIIIRELKLKLNPEMNFLYKFISFFFIYFLIITVSVVESNDFVNNRFWVTRIKSANSNEIINLAKRNGFRFHKKVSLIWS